jgi:hypothetical protein
LTAQFWSPGVWTVRREITIFTPKFDTADERKFVQKWLVLCAPTMPAGPLIHVVRADPFADEAEKPPTWTPHYSNPFGQWMLR